MAFEIIVCVSAYYICNKKTRFFEDVSTARTVVLVESACFHTQQYRHCPFCRPTSQRSPRVPWTRLGQSSVAFPSSSPSPLWWCCTKTLLSDNTGLCSKSKHFQGRLGCSSPPFPHLWALCTVIVRLLPNLSALHRYPVF